MSSHPAPSRLITFGIFLSSRRHGILLVIGALSAGAGTSAAKQGAPNHSASQAPSTSSFQASLPPEARAATSTRFYTNGPNSRVSAISVSGQNVYLGGAFTAIGPLKSNLIARWDGTRWHAMGLPEEYLGWVNAIAASESEVFAGGIFTKAGTSDTAYLMRWNGAFWAEFGKQQIQVTVSALALDGKDLYVGMHEGRLGRTLAFQGIARWNGTEWSSLNGGAVGEGRVECIKVRPDGIYVAGEFTSIGGLETFSVAKWDRSQWQALGAGLGTDRRGYEPVTALEFFGGNLYAGGRFEVAGDTSLSYLAMWDGQRWQGVSIGFLAGMDEEPSVSSVGALAVWEGALYVATRRVPLRGRSAASLGKWDGARWSLIEDRVEGPETRLANIAEIGVTESGLLVAGDFESLGNRSVLNLGRWTGNGWSSLVAETGLGLVAPVHRLVVDGTRLYAGGNFMQAGAQRANGIAVLDKESWTGLGRTFFHQATDYRAHIGALAAGNGHVYVAGEFTDTVNGLLNIGHWDGTRWDSMRSENKWFGIINNFKIHEGKAYAAGSFDSIGGLRDLGGPPARNLARFENEGWVPVSEVQLPKGSVSDLEFIGDTVYAVVVYDNEPTSGYVAGWDGHKWNSLGRGMSIGNWSGYDNGANEDEISSGPTDSRGGFERDLLGTGTALNRQAGLERPILLRKGNRLYLGGRFRISDQPEIENLAVWSDSAWKEVEPGSRGFPHGVTAMALHEENVIVAWSDADNFEEYGAPAGVDLWNGSRWIPLAREILKSETFFRSGAFVRTLAVLGNDLYLGGQFDRVNGIPSHGIAHIDLTPFSSGTRFSIKSYPKTRASWLSSTLVPSGSRAAGVLVSEGVGAPVFDLQGRSLGLPPLSTFRRK